MALSDVQIRKSKPAASIVKLFDEGGLQLWIAPDGAKRWRQAYRFGGVQKVLALGVYPAIGLRDARDARDAARRLLADGRDPAAARKLAKAAATAASANTFGAIAAELLAKKRSEAKAVRTLGKIEWLLGLAAPTIGTRPVAEISAPEILSVLRGVEARGKFENSQAAASNNRTGFPLRYCDRPRQWRSAAWGDSVARLYGTALRSSNLRRSVPYCARRRLTRVRWKRDRRWPCLP